MDLGAFHAQSGSWYVPTTISNQIADFQSTLATLGKQRPFYLQEPLRFDKRGDGYDPDLTQTDYQNAAKAARQCGAAAWTFHSKAGFHLAGASSTTMGNFLARMTVDEAAAITTMAGV
jgi:hypothetical protein